MPLVTDLAIRYGFQLLGAAVILVVGFMIAGWSARALDRRLTTSGMEPPMRLLLARVTRFTLLLLALVVALDKFGFQIAPLVAGIGVAGVGVGLAMQGVLGNLVAGLNFGHTRQLDLSVTLPHAADVQHAMNVARVIVARNPRVLKDPAALIGIASITESGVKVAVCPWVRVADFGPAEAELNQDILEQFRATGIKMASPYREIRMVNGQAAPPAAATRGT